MRSARAVTASSCSGGEVGAGARLAASRGPCPSPRTGRPAAGRPGGEEVAEGSREGPFGVEEGREVDGPQRLGGRGARDRQGFDDRALFGRARSSTRGAIRSAGTSRILAASATSVGLGEIAVAVVGGLRQRVGEAGLDALRAVLGDADGRGDRVGGLEADAPHVGGESVRLPPDGFVPIRRRTSCRSSPRGRWSTPTPCRKIMTCLIAFCSAQASVIRVLRFGPRPRDLDEAARLVVDDVHDVDAEVADHPFGHHGADALDQARSEVPSGCLARSPGARWCRSRRRTGGRTSGARSSGRAAAVTRRSARRAAGRPR